MGRRYYVTGDSSDLTGGADFDLALSVTPESTGITSGSQIVNVPASTTSNNYFYTPPLHPGPINFREYAINRGWTIEDGFNGPVRALLLDSNGKLYVGGEFTTYKGEAANRIIRLNSDGTKDIGFDNSTGFDSIVYSLVLDSNGKLYVAGLFSTYKGNTENRIIRLNPDGTKDTAFDNSTGFSGGTVWSLQLDSNGKLYVGGAFTSYKGTTANYIIRLNDDGTKDTGFDNSTGFNSTVRALLLDSNGKLYVGGDFTTYKGTTANYIIRLNDDGTKDTGFDNSTGFNNPVYSVKLDSNGKLYVGGSFTTYKGNTENRIIRLNDDGTKDMGFDNSTGFNNVARSLVLDSNGKLYVGGDFTTYKGTTENYIIRLNTDGTKDTAFDNTGLSSAVRVLAVDSNNKLYVGGAFTSYKSVPANYLTYLNSDGTVDYTFNTEDGFNSTVYALALDSNGKLYVGGAFTTYKGTTENYIIRLNPDGTKDTGFDNSTGFNNPVWSLQLDSNGKLYVGGQFTTYKGTTENRIIRLNSDGTKDTGFDNSTGFNSTVYSLLLDSSGKLYVGGAFSSYKGTTANRIIRLNSDGTKDTAFDNSTGFNTDVEILLLDSNGKLYVGGEFTTYKGNTENYIIRLNTDGTKDTGFDNSTGFNSPVNALALDSNGKLYVGGLFTTYKGTTETRIIRLNSDGTKDTGFDNSTGFNSTVRSFQIDSNGKLYVGGSFTTYKGTTANGIIRLNSDGSKDTAFDNSTGFNSTVIALALDSNGKLYVGGGFSTYRGATNNRIIRLNDDGGGFTEIVAPAQYASLFSNVVSGFNGSVIALLLDSNGKLYVGGSFTTYKGETANRIIRLNPDGTKDTAFDNSTGFNGNVWSFQIDSNGKLYVGGFFTTYKGNTENYIIRLNTDGSKDTGFDNSTGFNLGVRALLLDSNGKLYVGGQFTAYKGTTANRIIRLNTDGTKDTGFDNSTGFNNIVNSLLLDSNGKLYVGGLFTTYKGTTANAIIRLNTDGTKDTGFDNSTGFNDSVHSFQIDSNGKLYVGGNFTTYKGTTANAIIRLNDDGTKDTAFDNSTGFESQVNELVLDSNGKLYVGGNFTTYKGASQLYIAKLNSFGAIENEHPQFLLNLSTAGGLVISASLEKITNLNSVVRTQTSANSVTISPPFSQLDTFTTAGATSSTVPTGAVTAIVRAWGGGGGGGGRNNSGAGGAGGGGGGAYAYSSFNVTPGQTISVTVGSAGTAGTSNGNGGKGGDTIITYQSVIRAEADGGNGGTGGISGAGGTGGIVAVGDGFSGGNGANGSVTVGGGGGGGAGTEGVGGNASGQTAGTGTAESGGNGGDGGSNSAGTAGSVAGGGGGGGSRTGGGAKAGAAGAIGRAEILYQGAENTFTDPLLFYFPELDIGAFMKSERLRVKLITQNTEASEQSLTFFDGGTYLDFPAPTIQRRST